MGHRKSTMEDMVNIEKLLGTAYRNKKVLVTGHTGFKGSWLIASLHVLGANVCGYALPPERKKDLYNLLHGNRLCHSVIGDIRNKKKLKKSILKFKPDFIFHLAAQPLVSEGYRIPAETFEINTMGTLNLLNALRKLNKKCVVIVVTTDKVYADNKRGSAYSETAPLGGADPYSASKAGAELVVSSFTHSFFHPEKISTHKKSIASVRGGNVIGGGDWNKDRLIPDIAIALSKNKPVILRNPSSVRPWQHVLDALSGYLILGAMMNKQPAAFGGTWNFGPYHNDVLTVKQATQIAIKTWKAETTKIQYKKAVFHETHLLKLNINKSLSHLPWKPCLKGKAAVSDAIQWYKAYYEGTFQQEEIFNFIKTFLKKYPG